MLIACRLEYNRKRRQLDRTAARCTSSTARGKSELHRAVCRITSGQPVSKPVDGKRHRKYTARKGKGEKVRQERTAVAAMPRAWQTPHGARPNREEAWFRLGAYRLDTLNLRVGRLSHTAMCGLEEWSSCGCLSRWLRSVTKRLCRQNSAYRSGCLVFSLCSALAEEHDQRFPRASSSRRLNTNQRSQGASCPHQAAVPKFAAAVPAKKKSRAFVSGWR